MHAYAEFNHGRWIVPCPNCASAAYCDGRHDYAIGWGDDFRCIECGVRDVKVVYPDRLEVEAYMLGRPEANKNWRPGERLKDA